jgi:hypothetical protein
MPIQGKHDDTDWMVEYKTDSGDTDFLSVTSSSNEKLARDHIQRIFDLHNRNPDSPDQRELVSIKPGNAKRLRKLATERLEAGKPNLQNGVTVEETNTSTDTGSGE